MSKIVAIVFSLTLSLLPWRDDGDDDNDVKGVLEEPTMPRDDDDDKDPPPRTVLIIPKLLRDRLLLNASDAWSGAQAKHENNRVQ